MSNRVVSVRSFPRVGLLVLLFSLAQLSAVVQHCWPNYQPLIVLIICAYYMLVCSVYVCMCMLMLCVCVCMVQ